MYNRRNRKLKAKGRVNSEEQWRSSGRKKALSVFYSLGIFENKWGRLFCANSTMSPTCKGKQNWDSRRWIVVEKKFSWGEFGLIASVTTQTWCYHHVWGVAALYQAMMQLDQSQSPLCWRKCSASRRCFQTVSCWRLWLSFAICSCCWGSELNFFQPLKRIVWSATRGKPQGVNDKGDLLINLNISWLVRLVGWKDFIMLYWYWKLQLQGWWTQKWPHADCKHH